MPNFFLIHMTRPWALCGLREKTHTRCSPFTQYQTSFSSPWQSHGPCVGLQEKTTRSPFARTSWPKPSNWGTHLPRWSCQSSRMYKTSKIRALEPHPQTQNFHRQSRVSLPALLQKTWGTLWIPSCLPHALLLWCTISSFQAHDTAVEPNGVEERIVSETVN